MLNFQKLVLSTTNACNFRCRHCYSSSGSSPEEIYKFSNDKTMTAQRAEGYIRQVSELKNVRRQLHLAGGESTIFEDELKAIISIGKKYGFEVGLVTNASWAKNQKKADDFIKDLTKKGLVYAEISLSCFHQEFLDIDYFIRAIRACRKFGLRVTLRLSVTKINTAAKALKNIPSEDLRGVIIAISKSLPIGRAKEAILESDFFHNKLNHYYGCYADLNLVIRQDASVYPCCSGADITDSLCLGNADTELIKDIITRAELDPFLGILFFQGPLYLTEIFRQHTGKDFTQKRYASICDLCNELFIDNEVAKELRLAVYEHLQQKIIL